MPKLKSPGQKRKKWVRVIAILIFIVATCAASLLAKMINDESLSWVADHVAVQGVVTERSYEREEYRNRKGRKRYRDVYQLSYEFTAAGETYSNWVSVGESLYENMEEGGTVTIWHASDDPYINDLKENVESRVSGSDSAGNIVSAITFTAPTCLFLYWLLNLLFVREPKNALPEGFYTENTWLDIDDNYLVMLDGSDLVFFNIDKKHSSDAQEAYQNNASLEALMAASKSSNFKRIPLPEITELLSHHNSDVFVIEHGDDTHTVEFLNRTVKAHALERVKPFIPETLVYSKKERSRLQAAVPSSLVLTILIAIGYFVDSLLLNLALGFIAIVWVVPTIISRLIDPTVTEKWSTEVEEPKDAGISEG